MWLWETFEPCCARQLPWIGRLIRRVFFLWQTGAVSKKSRYDQRGMEDIGVLQHGNIRPSLMLDIRHRWKLPPLSPHTIQELPSHINISVMFISPAQLLVNINWSPGARNSPKSIHNLRRNHHCCTLLRNLHWFFSYDPRASQRASMYIHHSKACLCAVPLQRHFQLHRMSNKYGNILRCQSITHRVFS